MPILTLHGAEVQTVFDLLGKKEDDVTYSLGWGLSHSDELARLLLRAVFDRQSGEILSVRLQEILPGSGRTDIEIESERLHLIVEAKRAYELPNWRQLEQYARRLHGAKDQAILVTSAWSPAYAAEALPSTVLRQRIAYRSWNQIAALVAQRIQESRGNEQRLLRELHRYLKGVMTVQEIGSNLVYVVSLGVKEIGKSGLSFKDIVVEHNRYFHNLGAGGGWPRVPPNYLGFRFDGKLQQIRHVEGYEEVIPERSGMPGFPQLDGNLVWKPGPHFLYHLGPVITPQHETRTGHLYKNMRVWAALDLLLTSSTISEARDLTKARRDAAGAG
jgi:hypothetical protein